VREEPRISGGGSERERACALTPLPLHHLPPSLSPALQGLGYTAEDSAGQSNIFAVEPKTYVAGSSKDPKAGSGSLVYAVTAGVIGAAAIAAGVSLTAQESREFWSFLFSARTPSPRSLSSVSLTHTHALSLSLSLPLPLSSPFCRENGRRDHAPVRVRVQVWRCVRGPIRACAGG